MERFFLKNWVVGGLASLLLAVLLSCGEDAGLGASIDTKAPTLSITYPDSGAAIRDSFILAGDCSDDKAISRILVTVKNLESGVDYGTYPATVSPAQTSWQVTLNEYDSNNASYYNGWQLPDGKYEVSVTAYDFAGNNSGVSSRQFEVDNTPPVFIISNPGVVKSSGLKASAYGSLFTIDGTISDNHPISYMDVKIFRTSDGQLLSHETYEGSAIDFYREEDIATAGGSSVTIAQWSDTATQTAKTRYTDIYGENEEAGTIEYFAQIALYDSAKVYKNPPKNSSRSAVEVAADVYGNSTSTVYLYDDVYTALMSAKKGLGLSAANLKDILAGLDKGEKATAALSTLSANAKNTEADANRLYFSLNPQANPTYNVNGFKFGFGSGESQLASPGNTVSVTVSAGLDGTNINPELVKIWVKKYESKPTDENALKVELDKLNQKVIELTKQDAEFTEDVTKITVDSGEWLLIYDYSKHNAKGSSVATKTFSVTLPAIKDENNADYIELEKFYIFGATGHDIDDVRFAQNIVYGFEGNASGVPPTFAFDDSEGSITPKSLSIWNNFTAPKFSGTAIITTGNYYVKEITATLTLKNETDNTTIGTYADTMTSDKSTGETLWTQSTAAALNWVENKWVLDLTKLPGLDSLDISNKQILASLVISGKASTGHSGSVSRDIHIDTVAPVVTMTSITPSVSGKEYFGKIDETNYDENTYLNGIITVKGNVEEQNLKSVSYDIWASTNLSDTLSASNSILADLIAKKNELGLTSGIADGDFDGKLGKVFTLNVPFPTTSITKYFHDYKGAAEDAKIQVELVITAEDEAGNKGSYSSKTLLNDNGKNYIVYQETDRPKITLGNADATVTSANGINVNTNLFGTTNNNKLQISFEDDDSIREYKISLFKEDGTSAASLNEVYGTGTNEYTQYPGKTSASVNFLLPETEGKYQVKIEAKDYLSTGLNENPYGEKTVGNFFIAVDSGAPNITITKPVAASYQNGTVQVEGTVSKKEGVTITGELKTDTGTSVTGNGTSISAVTIEENATNGVYKWTGTVTLPTSASGSYVLSYKAEEGYGQHTSTTVGFVVDITAPTFSISGTDYDIFTADDMYTAKGEIIDGAATSGIKGFYYSLTEPAVENDSYKIFDTDEKTLLSNWKSAAVAATTTTGTYNWTANVELTGITSTDGTVRNTVYFAVVDEAGNISSVSANSDSNRLKVTRDTVAPSTTLLGTGLKKPAKNVVSGETGSKDEAGNLILEANSALSETITYYATDATNGYTISGVVIEASNTAKVTLDGTSVTPDSNGKWEIAGKTTDGTYSHKIVVTDKAGNSITKTVSVIRDTAKPTLTVSNDTNDSDALNTSKIITEENVNYSSSGGVHYYLLSGKWSDTTSGTYKLQYRVSPKHDSGTYSDEWSEWRDVTDVTQSTAESSWSIKVPMTEGFGIGSGVGLQGRAIDAAGNVFEHAGHSGLMLDFGAPSFSDVSTVPAYVKKGETLTITGEYSDSFSVKDVTCVAKKDGVEVTNETSGYTFATEKVTEITVPGSDNYKLFRKGKFTITVVANDDNNGNWTFDLAVTDKANRTTNLETLKTVVDTKKPVWNVNSFQVNKESYSSSGENWYKSSALPFTGTVAENGSGIKEIKYSVIKAGVSGEPTYAESFATTKETVGTESFSANLGEFIAKLGADGNAVANKVYMKAVDYAGNESDAPTFNIFVDTESPTFTCAQSGTQVTNGTKDIAASGTFDDDASGVKSVTLEVTYTENGEKKTKTFAATLDSSAKTWTKEISASELTVDATYAVTASVEDNAGNKSSSSVFNIQKDTEKPVFKTPSVEGTSTKYTVYKPNANENTYFINNTDGKFSISGVATDNFGVEKVELSISGENGKSYTPDAATNGVYSFANIDLSDWTGEATATLTVTDKAGNTNATPLTITLKFDSTAPKGIHALDDKNKDLYFRIGDYDNELATLGELDKDVGGKYSENTYGNANTIKVRGKFDDTDSGSGVNMIYYKVVNATSAMSYSELKTQAKNFLAKYNDSTEYTGYFAPIASAKLSKEKRSVSYTSTDGKIKEKIIGSDGKIAYAEGDALVSSDTTKTDKNGETQYYTDITTNYSSTLSGFTEGLNYLILVAVDNVGNAALDSVVSGTVGADGSEKTFYNASLNVDTVTPSSTTTSEIQYTNGAEGCADITVSGTATDAAAGVRSVEISVNGKTIKVGETTYGTLTVNGNTGDNSRTWSVTIKAHEVFGDDGTTNGTKSVSAIVIDNAGSGNKNTVPVASVMVDKTAPTVTLTAPTDADSETTDIQVNGKISLSGTISDGNVLPDTAITGLQYIKSDTKPAADASWTNATGVTCSGNYTYKIEDFDTTNLEDGKTYWIRAVAKDKAGNIGYSDTVKAGETTSKDVKVIVSQDSDRPKVNISNLEYNETLGKFLLRQGTNARVTGRVSDDDSSLGTNVVSKLYITESAYTGAATETEPATNYASSSGEFTFQPSNTIDGDKTFYIYIEDNAGGKFYSTYTSVSETVTTNDKLKNPKILVKGTARTESDDAKIEYLSDSNSPSIGDAKGTSYSKSGTEYTEDSESKDANLNASLVVGGTKRKYLKLTFTAKDASGVGGMMAMISDTKAEPTELRIATSRDFTGAPTGDDAIPSDDVNGTFTPSSNKDSDASWTTDYIDVSGWQTGQITLKLTVYDRIGNAASGSYTFNADNTAPEIKITSPANGEEKTGDISIIGTAYDTGDAGTADLQWLVPTNDEVTASKTSSLGKLEYFRTLTVDVDGTSVSKWNGGEKSLANGTSLKAWQFDFNGKFDTQTSKPESYIYKVGNPALTAFDLDPAAVAKFVKNDDYLTSGLYYIPIYFMATDALGNYSIKEDYVIHHNLDGDKPNVKITYPTSENYDVTTNGTGENATTTKQTYATLGGTISVTGSAEIPSNTTTVKKVYIQIASDAGNFNDADKTKALTAGDVKTKTGTKADGSTYEYSENEGGYGFTVVDAYKPLKDATGKEYVATETEVTEGKILMTDALAQGYGFKDKVALDAWWGIEVSNTTSWRMQLNSDGFMNPAGNATDTNNIKIRACGMNANGKFGAWTTGDDGVISIHIDNNVPVLSASVKQYASAITSTTTTLPNELASQHYSADMFLRGENWYIVLDARDESGIKTVAVKNGTTSVTDFKEINLELDTSRKKGKRVYIPITTTNVTSVSYNVEATEDSSDASQQVHSTKATYSFKIDNQAPSLEEIKDGSGNVLSTSTTAKNTVQNSQYVYTISGVSDDREGGSGVERVVFYYMRKAGTTQASITKEVVLDPMIKPTTTTTNGVTTTTYGSKVTLGDLTPIDLGLGTGKEVLYAEKISGSVSKDSNGSFNKFTASSNFDAHIRDGGLVKIDGLFRKISTVSGNVVTFTPAATAASTGDAYFPIAQVIDANNTADSNAANPFEFTKKADDGDGMVESFSKSGTKWTWDATIHSENLPDGPATLVILAFDEAGNVAGKSYKMMVSNNAPRLAKVFLGTDLNHDDEYSDNEFETYNIIGATGNSEGEEAYDLKTAEFKKYTLNAKDEWVGSDSSRGSFTIKKGLVVLPEFVGGNGEAKLVFKNNETTTLKDGKAVSDLTGKPGTATAKSGTLASSEDETSADYGRTITGNYWKLTSLGDDTKTSASTPATTKSMSFTFWDNTEECTQGNNSQYAFLCVTDFVVDQTDDVAPNVVVSPFEWNQAGHGTYTAANGEIKYKNNLFYAYTDTTDDTSGETTRTYSDEVLGHIELESDWKETATYKAQTGTAQTSGEFDLDPKVSGKIIIRGTAYDDTLLGTLTFSMTNFKNSTTTALTMAEYKTTTDETTGKKTSAWDVSSATMAASDYEVTVEDVYMNQDGHKVNWTVSIDTSKLSDVAHNDAVFTVTASDQKSGTANTSANSTGTATGTTDATKHKPTYRMDVVPYITGMYTALADSAGEEFARSATGRYIVRENESVKLYGFNLKAASNAVKIGSANVTPTAGGSDTKGSYLTLPIGTSSSGAVYITVNSVESLNNKNMNPTFTSLTDDTITAVAYNSCADGTANNRLTDDVSLWVWKLGAFDTQMNSKNITSPMMKFDASGNYYISYGQGSNMFAIDKNGTSTQLEKCYNKYHNTNVAFDGSGNFYGVATDTDRVSYEMGGATSFTFFSRALGSSYETVGYQNANADHLQNAYAHYSRGSNKRRLELSQYGGDNGTYNINRVQRPKLTVSGNTTSAGVYMAYYDASADNVKFRYGTVTGEESLSYNNRTRAYTRTGTMSGGIENDLTGNGTDTSSATGYHLIANSSTTFKPGAYTAVGYTSSGAAVVAWYDAEARRLVYSYNDAPGTVVTSTSSTTNTWQKNAVYLDSAYTGWYVDLAVDDANGVHIAYYNSKSGDLKYAYLKDYNKPTEAVTVTVDSYLSVGTNITINVRDEGTDVTDETTNETTHTANYVPYIYYYNTSSNQTMNSIKVAWRNDMKTLRAGAIDDKFTGAWESMTVPTENIPVDATVCGGVPTEKVDSVGDFTNTVVLAYMTDQYFEKAYIKK